MIEPKSFIWNTTKAMDSDPEFLNKHNQASAAKGRIKKTQKPKPTKEELKRIMIQYGTNEREIKSRARWGNVARCRRQIIRLLRGYGFNSFDIAAVINREASGVRRIWNEA